MDMALLIAGCLCLILRAGEYFESILSYSRFVQAHLIVSRCVEEVITSTHSREACPLLEGSSAAGKHGCVQQHQSDGGQADHVRRDFTCQAILEDLHTIYGRSRDVDRLRRRRQRLNRIKRLLLYAKSSSAHPMGKVAEVIEGININLAIAVKCLSIKGDGHT